MGELRNQVDQAIAGASMFGKEAITGARFLDPESAGYGKPQALNIDDEMTAIRDAIGGLITAVRILADRLDPH
jgi:hypothetical protein